MIVCLCLARSDRTIRAAIARGALSLDELAAACDAGTGCGACLPALERMIEEAGEPVRRQQPRAIREGSPPAPVQGPQSKGRVGRLDAVTYADRIEA